MSKLAAVILTGTRDQHNPLLTGTGLGSKALLPVFGKAMLQWVCDALRNTRYAPTLYVSTRDPDIERHEFGVPVSVIPSGESAVDSFLKAVDGVSADVSGNMADDIEWVLLVSGDHVLLTPDMVTFFVDEAQRRKRALAVGVVAKSTVRAHYPESRRTYLPLKGDAYSGANLYLVHQPSFVGRQAVLEAVDRNRKAPWKSIFMMDWRSVLRVFARQVDIHELSVLTSKTLGCDTTYVVLPFAEACMDVDKPSDKAIAEAILKRRQRLIVPSP